MLSLVFTRAEALRGGHDAKAIDARVRSGEWTALRRGVYAETARLPLDLAERHAADVAAAARATGQDVVGSHESAALIHGLTTFSAYDGPPVLSRFRELRRERPGGATPAPLVAHVPEHHRTEVLEAPVTTMARTAVDLARKGPALSAVVVLDSALRREVTREELEEVLRIGRGWPGSRKAADLVAFADGRAESALESVGRYRMWQLGLPKPELQIPLYDAFGLMGYPDFLWEELRVIGEADGLLKYREEDPDAPRTYAIATRWLWRSSARTGSATAATRCSAPRGRWPCTGRRSWSSARCCCRRTSGSAGGGPKLRLVAAEVGGREVAR